MPYITKQEAKQETDLLVKSKPFVGGIIGHGTTYYNIRGLSDPSLPF